MIMINMTNTEIKAAGGVYIGTETYFDNHYGGWMTHEVFLLNGEEVISNSDWDFQNP